jgi:hypothetical protein
MNTLQFKGIPILRIGSYHEAVDFYVSFLKFRIDWEHRFNENDPVYMQLSKDQLILQLTENKRFDGCSAVYVETKGLEDFAREIGTVKGKFEIPAITVTPWATLQLEIKDPFGNLMRFNEYSPENKSR